MGLVLLVLHLGLARVGLGVVSNIRRVALVALEPAAQAEHSSVPASRASLPAPHDVSYVAPSEQELPAVQLSHPSRLRPVKSPKLPAAHGFATVEPASQ